MRQTFRVKDEGTLWQLESELRGLGFKWSGGQDSHVKRILKEPDPFPVYIHVYTEDRTLTWSSCLTMVLVGYPVDATFETGQSLFMDSDGSVHIYETSKQLDEPKEPQYRYVQVSVDEVLKDFNRNVSAYYYETDDYEGLRLLWDCSPKFTIDELIETRFYKREEF